MISLELSKKLKEAGLEWEPQIGDMFYWQNGKDWGIDALTSEDVNDRLDETKDFIEERVWIFAPRLDQLLAEIEKRGYKWFLETDRETYFIRIIKPGDTKEPVSFKAYAKSLVDAAASALLWILEGGTSK